jgi:signal peptidase I
MSVLASSGSWALLVVLVVFTLGYFPARVRRATPLFQEQSWGCRSVALELAVVFGVSLWQIQGVQFWTRWLPEAGVSFLALLMLLELGPIGYIVGVREGRSLQSLGFRRERALFLSATAGAGYFLFRFLCVLITYHTGGIGGAASPGPGDQPASLGASLLEGVALSPFTCMEEVVFRGFALLPVARVAGARIAIATTALAWSLSHFHYSTPERGAIFVLGLVLGWVFYRTESLYPVITLHVLINLTAAIQKWLPTASPWTPQRYLWDIGGGTLALALASAGIALATRGRPPAKPEPVLPADRRPWRAALLSLCCPGLGHVYLGQSARGVLWHAGLFGTGLLLLLVTLWAPFFRFNVLVPVLGYLGVYAAIAGEAGRRARRMRGSPVPLKPHPTWPVYGLLLLLGLLIGDLTERSTVHAIVEHAGLSTDGMRPTLLKGDQFLIDKLWYFRHPLHRGDVILYRHQSDDSRTFVHRIIGLPGEQVEIWGHEVRINGTPLPEPYARSSTGAGSGGAAFTGPITLPPDKLFVLGDDRETASDSRKWGLVDRAKIVGKVVQVYFSWDPAGPIRWPRIGTEVR